MASIPQPSPDAAPGFIALEGGGSRVEIVPRHGGRIRSMRIGGREWLMQAADASGPRSGQPAIAGAGWDECAPASGGGTVPEWVQGIGGRPVPAGGEARLQEPQVALRTGAEGHHVTCRWRGERLPWTLTRELVVRPDGAIEARYEALASGTHRLPFLWCANLLLPLDGTTRLRFPDAARLRIASVTGATAVGSATGGESNWPRLTLDGRPRDLSVPWSVPRATVLSGWIDLGHARAMIQLEHEQARLAIHCDGEGVPFCGLVIDRSGNAEGRTKPGFGRRARPLLALRPSLGAPDRYAEALGDWQSVTWLVPGEPRRWTLTFRSAPTDGMAH